MMNPTELVADLPVPPGQAREALLYARILLRYLGDHLYYATLSNGERVCDVMNSRRWLEEVAEAIRERSSQERGGPALTLELQQKACARCGHVHQDKKCGEDMGGAGPCPCELSVSA